MKRTVLLATLLVLAFGADAQSRSGRSQRPPPMEGGTPSNAYYKSAPVGASDPMAALERELPSLRVDLKIAGEQSPLWDSFERQVRDVAELGRARQKHLLAPLEADKPAPPAMTLVALWASDDRARAAAMDALVPKLEALQGALSESQRKELDRRIVLSQTEPLNATPPSDERGRRSQR
jgi:hypothetical protein